MSKSIYNIVASGKQEKDHQTNDKQQCRVCNPHLNYSSVRQFPENLEYRDVLGQIYLLNTDQPCYIIHDGGIRKQPRRIESDSGH
ncbi:hypothetical protein NDU88_000504 [Pleurodeles waltl]|uniref:Uncharacterized protein n=1 Tax=Pleurodeles waltl TaxID=8319 RepID=A0AAV7KY08_PLEWA|nr:hypothetical protein NDU88_000504 [Pleurodeles waltl]